MNKLNTLLAIACMVGTMFVACKNEPKTAATTTETPKAPDTIKVEPLPSSDGAATYTVTEGTVNWVGRKKALKGEHHGTLKVKGGTISVKEGRILGGKVEVDMNSLTVLDITDAAERGQLENHLKSPDFFWAGRYPTAEFSIGEVLPSNLPDFNNVIAGTLKMRDKTDVVNIPVKMKVTDSDLTVESATFIINRTKWGVNFGSGVINTVKDKLIDDNVSLALTVKAVKK
jgi:polyisoprenoid-binding protein YceI